MMMFSLFIDGDRSTYFEVLELTLFILTLSLINYIALIIFGQFLGRSSHPVTKWIQQYGFAGLLMLVGTLLIAHQFEIL